MRNEKINRSNEHEGLSSLRFDYDSVSLPLAKFLKGQADRIRRHCASSTLQIGKALLEAKRHLSHGAFLRWVEWEVCIPARTAQAYMRVASWALDKSATVADLSPSVLYLLSASSTPDDFVTDVLSRAEAGEHIAPTVMRQELKALRASERRQSPIADVSASRAADSLQLAASDESGTVGRLKELVSILSGGLSASDFERVRKILTSDVVISNPYFAENLVRAFEAEPRVFMMLVSRRSDCDSLDATA